MSKHLVVIAHNIRSAYNVGAIFRTADGMGASKLFLTGYSPTPYDGKKILQTAAQKMISKTALGSEKHLPWEYQENIMELLDEMRNPPAGGESFEIVALEQDERSVDYRKFESKKSVALIVGNEPAGMEKEVVQVCDAVIEIPMRGMKNSLNVAVAFGIAGYELYNKIRN